MVVYPPSAQLEAITNSYLRHGGGPAPKEWVALRRLFRNPWFERVWVAQEVAMAREVYVLYGGRYMDWGMLMSVMEVFTRQEATILRSFIVRIDENRMATVPSGLQNGWFMNSCRQRSRAGAEIQLHLMLRGSLNFRATAPVDKIYAIQSFTEEAEHPDLPIKYSKDLNDPSEISRVLINTARYFLQSPQSLRILQLAGIGWKRDHKDLPSWVVDWTMTRPAYVLSYSDVGNSPAAFRAATRMRPKIQHDQRNNSLEMSGILIDEIDELGDAHNSFDFYTNTEAQRDQRDLDRVWHAWFRRAEDIIERNVSKTYHNGQPRHEAFWRTIIADKDKAKRPAGPEYYKNYLDFRADGIRKHFAPLRGTALGKAPLTESEREILRNKDRDPRPENIALFGGWAFSNALGAACNDRQFAVTRRGYMAIVPLLARSGDSICLVLGTDVPFVLRKIPIHQSKEKYGQKQCYNLVGECYVHGIMDGEGLEVLDKTGGWRLIEDILVL